MWDFYVTIDEKSPPYKEPAWGFLWSFRSPSRRGGTGQRFTGKTGPMEHWAYLTDDDEPTKKETTPGAFTFQQPDANERRSAGCSRSDHTDAAAVTNGLCDPSRWQL